MKTDNLQNCEHHVLICVKSKHGCDSGMLRNDKLDLCGRDVSLGWERVCFNWSN